MLVRSRADLNVMEVVVLAVEGEGLPSPAMADDFHSFFKEGDPVRHGHVECLEVGRLIADAHSQDDSAPGHHVQSDHVFGQMHRVVQRQKDHRCAEV